MYQRSSLELISSLTKSTQTTGQIPSTSSLTGFGNRYDSNKVSAGINTPRDENLGIPSAPAEFKNPSGGPTLKEISSKLKDLSESQMKLNRSKKPHPYIVMALPAVSKE